MRRASLRNPAERDAGRFREGKPDRLTDRRTLLPRWFWYSILCAVCWGAWAILAKLGSREIPPQAMTFLFNVGTLPVGLSVYAARRFKIEKSLPGISFALSIAVVGSVGSIALFAAYHTTANTYVITVATSLYPVLTVFLAMIFLRERLSRYQAIGVAFAVIAIILFAI